MSKNKIDIDDVNESVIDVNNALIGLRHYTIDHFCGVRDIKRENLDGLRGLVEAVLSLSEKSVNRVENMNLIE